MAIERKRDDTSEIRVRQSGVVASVLAKWTDERGVDHYNTTYQRGAEHVLSEDVRKIDADRVR